MLTFKCNLVLIVAYSLFFIPSCRQMKQDSSQVKEVPQHQRKSVLDQLTKKSPMSRKVTEAFFDVIDEMDNMSEFPIVAFNKKTGELRKATTNEISGKDTLPDNTEFFLGTPKSKYISSIKFLGLDKRNNFVRILAEQFKISGKSLSRTDGVVLSINTQYKNKDELRSSIRSQMSEINSYINKTNLRDQIIAASSKYQQLDEERFNVKKHYKQRAHVSEGVKDLIAFSFAILPFLAVAVGTGAASAVRHVTKTPFLATTAAVIGAAFLILLLVVALHYNNYLQDQSAKDKEMRLKRIQAKMSKLILKYGNRIKPIEPRQ